MMGRSKTKTKVSKKVSGDYKYKKDSLLYPLSKRHIYLLLFILMVIILLSPFLKRYVIDKGPMAGDLSYNYQRVSLIQDRFHVQQDPLLSSRIISFGPYHYFLGILDRFWPLETSQKYLPFIFSIILFFSLLFVYNKLDFPLENFFYFLCILILSPAFVFTFFIPIDISLFLAIFSLALALLLSDFKIMPFFSYVLFLFVPLFNLHYSIFALSILLLILCYSDRKKPSLYITSIILVILSLFMFIVQGKQYIASASPLIIGPLLSTLISDFGAHIGIGVFHFILAFFGFFMSWKLKKSLIPLYLLFMFWIIISHHLLISYLIITCFLAFFGSFTFIHLSYIRWELKTLKNLTLLLLFCGLLFSTLSYVQRVSEFGPTSGFEEALSWLNKFEGDNVATIFSHFSRGNWIATLSGDSIVLDSGFSDVPDSYFRLNDSSRIFYSRNIDDTSVLLQKYSVSHIILDDRLKDKLFQSDDQGLLFLFNNKEVFDKLYYKDGVLIVRYNNPLIYAIQPTEER